MSEQERIRELERLLQDLTPGGSDFQQPERCAAWVRNELTRLIRKVVEATARANKAEDQLAACWAEVARLREVLADASGFIATANPRTAWERGILGRIGAALTADPSQDEVVIPDVGGNITASMRRAVEQALDSGQSVRFLEPVGLDALCGDEEPADGGIDRTLPPGSVSV